MEDNEFDLDKKINPEQLDIEAVQQADLFYKWAERAIEARMDMDRTKLQLELVENKLQIRARKEPEKFGMVKVTEAAVSATIFIHEERLAAYHELLKAKEISLLMDEAVKAMEQKKRMIEVLITLHGQKYFAGPSIPRDLGTAWKENQQKKEDCLSERQLRIARHRAKLAEKGISNTVPGDGEVGKD